MSIFDKKINEARIIYVNKGESDDKESTGLDKMADVLSKIADKGIGKSFKAVIKAPMVIPKAYKKFDDKMNDLESRTKERGLMGLFKEEDDELADNNPEEKEDDETNLDDLDVDTATVDSDIDNISVVDLARRALFIDPKEIGHYASPSQSEKLRSSVNNDNVKDIKELISNILNSSFDDVEVDSTGPGINE